MAPLDGHLAWGGRPSGHFAVHLHASSRVTKSYETHPYCIKQTSSSVADLVGDCKNYKFSFVTFFVNLQYFFCSSQVFS